MRFWRKIWFERLAPCFLGLATFTLIVIFRADVSAQFSESGWQAGNLYNAVFNWASIQSGFVFGIYGFIATKRDGFLGEIASDQPFNLLLGYTRRAYLAGFALTFASLPLMVAAPKIANVETASFWIVAVWFSSFVWIFCSFLRVAFVFGIIVAVPDKQKEIIG